MGRQRNNPLVSKLALAVAAGKTVTAWATENNVLPRTARNWARLPEFRQMVSAIRQKAIDRVTGKLSRHALKAVDQIAKLAKSGENDSVKLNAAKTIVTMLIEVETHAMTTRAMNDLATRLDNLERSDATPKETG
jgi:hypothetical protein